MGTARFVTVAVGVGAVFVFENACGDDVVTDVRTECYAADDRTVSRNSWGKRPVVGVVLGLGETIESAVGAAVSAARFAG